MKPAEEIKSFEELLDGNLDPYRLNSSIDEDKLREEQKKRYEGTYNIYG